MAFVGWALLATAGAGIDPGTGLPGAGPTAAALALALGAPAAIVATLLAWRQAAPRSGPARVAIGALAGLAAWSALSILWAGAPDLAWLDANRTAIGLSALLLGIGLAALIPHAGWRFGVALSAAAALPVLAALTLKAFPAIAGDDRDLARLSTPLTYWNALALVAVFALPGLMLIAARTERAPGGAWRQPPAALALAGAGIGLVVTTLVLTYSRAGMLIGVVVLALCVGLLPHRHRTLTAVLCGLAGALAPSIHALTSPALSEDMVAVADREGPGRWFALWLVVGALIAAALTVPGRRVARSAAERTLDRRRIAAVAGAVIAVGLAALVLTSPGRGWVGDRWQEVTGGQEQAVANDPSRIMNASSNQRVTWWAEAWRGFEAAPVVGQGAGGFRLVHLRERDNGDDTLVTVEPHDLVLRTLSGVGLVGFALLVALAAALVVAARRALRTARRIEVAAPLAVLVAFGLQAVVDWSWAIPALTVPALAAGGVLIALAAPGPAAGARRPGGAPVAGLTALAALVAASALLPWWSVRLNDRADLALVNDDPTTGLRLARAAAARNPLALGPLRTEARALNALGEPGQALAVTITMTRVQPDNPAAWRALARAWSTDSRSRDAWERVLALDPHDRAARAALGR